MSWRENQPPTFDSAARDQNYWSTLDAMFDELDFSRENILRNWPAYTMRRDIPRFLSHYELFKMIQDLPGCVVELGVFKGASFFSWGKFLEIFCPYDRSRRVYGFDHFGGLDDFTEADGAKDGSVHKVEGGYLATADEVRALVKLHNSDNLIPNTSRCVLIEGDVAESIPKFLEQTPGLSIALLHFDMDLYEPTRAGMELLYDLVLPGGVVCFDEYALVPWQGETRAVNEFFAARGIKRPVFKKHPWAQTPHAYFVKDA